MVSRPPPAGDGARGGVGPLSWARWRSVPRVIARDRPDLGPGRYAVYASPSSGRGKVPRPVRGLVPSFLSCGSSSRSTSSGSSSAWGRGAPRHPAAGAVRPGRRRPRRRTAARRLGRRLVASRRATALVAEPRRDALPGLRHPRSRLGHHRRRRHHAPGPPVELVPTPARRPRRPGRHRSSRPPRPLTPHRPCHPNHPPGARPQTPPASSRPNVARVPRRARSADGARLEPERRGWRGLRGAVDGVGRSSTDHAGGLSPGARG